jgi:hypothetical protein
MGRIRIPTQARVGHGEAPYWKVQMVPDRIFFSRPGTSHGILHGAIRGPIGYNSVIAKALDVLEKQGSIAAAGALRLAWQDYAAKATASQDLANDQVMIKALNDYQVLACVGSSYIELPLRAAKARYWERADEIVIPLITEAEHQAIGIRDYNL